MGWMYWNVKYKMQNAYSAIQDILSDVKGNKRATVVFIVKFFEDLWLRYSNGTVIGKCWQSVLNQERSREKRYEK